MIYEVGMLCKHFKGHNLHEKNIYRILELGLDGKDIDTSTIKYTGDNVLETAKNLVVYENIFQENKIFTREYDDISGELSDEKKSEFNQELRVQPLTDEEIELVTSENFINERLFGNGYNEALKR